MRANATNAKQQQQRQRQQQQHNLAVIEKCVNPRILMICCALSVQHGDKCLPTAKNHNQTEVKHRLKQQTKKIETHVRF